MSESPTRLLLVRHAVNDWVGSKLAGWTPGVHLNERGRTQAQALSQRLSAIELAAIYSSPLERAQETAEFVAAPHDLPVIVKEDLGEVRYGDWTAQTIEDLSKTELWQQVQFYPSGSRFPEGETMAEAQARAVATLDSLCATHRGQTIVAVSHADMIKAVVAYYAGIHLDLFQRLVIGPASVTEFIFTPFGPRLVRSNDCAHNPPEPEEPAQNNGADGASTEAESELQ